MTGLVFPLACFTSLAVSGAEVAVAGYARRPTTLAYTADGVTVANTTSLQWPYATASWGTLDTVALYDAPTGGKRLAVLAAVMPIEIRQYDAARIPAAGIVLIYVAVTRPYGAAGFGVDAFGFSRGLWPATAAVPIERVFGQQQHVCVPGIWAPGPCALAA